MQTIRTKPCERCKDPKPLDDFYRKKTSKDGRQSICKACEKKRDAPGAPVAPPPAHTRRGSQS